MRHVIEEAGMRQPCRTALVAIAMQATLGSAAWAAPMPWKVNRHLYDLVPVPAGIGWFDAQTAVEARGCGWYLSTITSAAEDAFIFGLYKGKAAFFTNGNGPWLGGFQRNSRAEKTGNWRWVTSEPFTYVDWAKGEPSNNTAGRQDTEPGVP